MTAGERPFSLDLWELPVYVRVGTGFLEAIDGPEEALAYLSNRWPSTRGPAYEEAKSACQLALNAYGSLHVSRDMFILAAIEASMLDEPMPASKISLTPEKLQQAYDAAARAFEIDGRFAINPYSVGSEEALYWDHGFRDAQKASDVGH